MSLRFRPIPVALALAVLATAGSEAVAQDGTVTASVIVMLPPATGTGVRGLDFGTLTPGTSVETLPTSPTAGQFRLDNVPRNRDVQLTFTFPVTLARSGGGGTGLPIHFDGPYASTCGNGCQTHTLAPTPAGDGQVTADATHVQPGPRWGSNPTTLDIFVGGRAEPSTGQAAGTYQGTVELTFAIL